MHCSLHRGRAASPVNKFLTSRGAHPPLQPAAATGYFFSAYPTAKWRRSSATTRCAMTRSPSLMATVVLHGSVWDFGRHLSLEFPDRVQPVQPFKNAGPSHPLTFLAAELKHTPLCRPSGALPATRPQTQVSIGFSRRGLAKLNVPAHVLSCFALKTQAFTAGAAVRATAVPRPSAPPPGRGIAAHRLDAVLTIHGNPTDEDSLVAENQEGCVAYLCCAAPAGDAPPRQSGWKTRRDKVVAPHRQKSGPLGVRTGSRASARRLTRADIKECSRFPFIDLVIREGYKQIRAPPKTPCPLRCGRRGTRFFATGASRMHQMSKLEVFESRRQGAKRLEIG